MKQNYISIFACTASQSTRTVGVDPPEKDTLVKMFLKSFQNCKMIKTGGSQ